MNLEYAQLMLTLQAMARYGGSFVSTLATAWYHADRANREKLAQAFPELLAKYGPGSEPYQQIAREFA